MYGSLSSYSGSSNLSDLYDNSMRVSSAFSIASWVQPALIISAIASVLIFFLFLAKKNEGKFTGFTAWVYDFLSFKKLTLEAILKILYIFCALYLTIMSFAYISISFWTFLLMITVGNVLVRVTYELLLMTVIICKNTTEINKKMKD